MNSVMGGSLRGTSSRNHWEPPELVPRFPTVGRGTGTGGNQLIVVWSGTLERQGRCEGLSSPFLGPNSSTYRAMRALPLARLALR